MIRFDSRVALRTRIFTPMLLLISSGCGNFNAGGVTGEARVTLLGDAPDPVPASLIAAPRVGRTRAFRPGAQAARAAGENSRRGIPRTTRRSRSGSNS
ncbi:MAG: hypothetical protein L7S64_08470, partial [Longimicrobiales bacterium]|nr:hypothetical protein [Longimicrobiales bacterium]